MKTIPDSKIILAVNAVSTLRVYSAGDFEIFAHAEEGGSEYWGLQSYRWDMYYFVSRHGNACSAYECRDRTHVKYMLVKSVF